MEGTRAMRRGGRHVLLPALSLLIACSACVLREVRTAPSRRLVQRRQIVALAESLAGIPYVYGGVDIDGFDCSGLVFYVYDCFGIRLPRSAGEQADLAGGVSWKRAVAGDILAFRLKDGWHTAIYIGDGRFVHAPSSRGWVRVEAMNDYWRQHLETVIAVLTSGRRAEDT